MNDPQDKRWHDLVALSAPTYQSETSPPYGFATRLLAQLHQQERQREAVERIGLRAIFASFALLVIVLGVTFSSGYFDGDLEPGLNNIVQVAEIQVS